MIPAGTGIKNYRDVKLFDESEKDLDVQMEEIVARRREEKELAEQVEDMGNISTSDEAD